MPPATPGKSSYDMLPVFFSGANLHATATSRTALGSNLKVGDIVQFDPHNHEARTDLPVVGTATSGFNSPVAPVAENVNAKTANTHLTAPLTRRDGVVKVVASRGVICKAKVNGATTNGVTRLCAVAGTQELQPFSAGTVDANNTLLGTGGKVVAIAAQTQGAVTAVIDVLWLGDVV